MIIQSLAYVTEALSKQRFILTGGGVEKSFPEGSNIDFGLRGSIKQTGEGKDPEGWDWSLQQRCRLGGKKMYLNSKTLFLIFLWVSHGDAKV